MILFRDCDYFQDCDYVKFLVRGDFFDCWPEMLFDQYFYCFLPEAAKTVILLVKYSKPALCITPTKDEQGLLCVLSLDVSISYYSLS